MGLIPKKTDLTPIWSESPLKSNKSKHHKPPTKTTRKKKVKKPLTKFDKYRMRVNELTEQVKHLIEGIENRGWHKYHIDHKISIKWGFDNNIPEKHIAHPDNLQMLWWKENFNKNIICEVDMKNKWIVGDLKIYENRSDIYFKEED
jgi:hypothetical protein